MLDLLLSRYSDIDFIMNLDMESGFKLITKGFEEQSNDRLYQRWIYHYEKEISFDEFKNELEKSIKNKSNRKIDNTRTEKEILEEVEEILNSYRGGA